MQDYSRLSREFFGVCPTKFLAKPSILGKTKIQMTRKLAHASTKENLRGRHYPLGATLRDGGVNFAIYSQHAEQVFLLLFDSPDGEATDTIRIDNRTREIFHVFIPGLRAGQLYGYKVRGPFNPAQGLRFNENKLLVDPYAKAVSGKCSNVNNLLFAYDANSPHQDLSFDARDSSAIVPKSIVVDDSFDWQGDAPPDIPFEDLLIYETHLKGFTAHPSANSKHSGTYLGFIDRIAHLKSLGVNAVELLPIHEFYVEDLLREKRLTNYWGYNTLSFFAPDCSYGTGTSPGCQVNEFKTMVRELHRVGMEVILDVVYNHSAEGNELGPTLSLKGIDNPSYYCLHGDVAEPKRLYTNFTGCGNSLNLSNPNVLRLVMDSLRYWAEVMHVDGFRFDLASVLAREQGAYDKSSSFFDAVTQDPVLSRIKLIAEPWDLGTYQVGNFPIDWAEWNGRFRDCIRKFGKGDGGQVRDLGYRLTGSSDLYGGDGRSPYHSINFITCHDGFTLMDLVSYNHKHNEANLENNRDGSDDNNCWNCGVEGPTTDPSILELRRRLAKNHICHLFFALGTPMLLSGDEFLRSQKGNNNAYCQDNELSWIDWEFLHTNADFFAFVKKAIAFRKRHKILHRLKFHVGRDTDANSFPDIAWLDPNLNPPAWNDPELRTLACQLDCREESVEDGDRLLFLVFNASPSHARVKVPRTHPGTFWRRVVDTSLPPPADFADPGEEIILDPADSYLVNPRTTLVLVSY